MTITVDAVVTPEHLGWIEETLRSRGVPGTVELFDQYLEITSPIWGDPVALEILRPIVEDVLLRLVQEIKKKG